MRPITGGLDKVLCLRQFLSRAGFEDPRKWKGKSLRVRLSYQDLIVLTPTWLTLIVLVLSTLSAPVRTVNVPSFASVLSGRDVIPTEVSSASVLISRTGTAASDDDG